MPLTFRWGNCILSHVKEKNRRGSSPRRLRQMNQRNLRILFLVGFSNFDGFLFSIIFSFSFGLAVAG